MEEIIRVENLTHTYGEGTPFCRSAVQDMSLAIYRGEFLGIIGHTGSGKSTLIQHLNGLLKPTSGRILLGGEDIWADPKKIRDVRFRVGLVFQYPEYQLFEETVYRDIAFGPTNMGLSKDEIDRRVRESAHFAGLTDDLLEKSPFALSGGQKRRVAIAGVIAMEPEVLVLDEPVDGLDPVMRRQIWSLALEDVAGYGTTVLVSSHNLRELEDICDYVGIMHEGRMLLERSLADLQDNFVKVQLVTEHPLPSSLQILHESTLGRVQTLILRGDPQTIADELAASAPMLCDLLPLGLEEIFIYELGGTGYDVKNLVL